jgi:hypothetical protein
MRKALTGIFATLLRNSAMRRAIANLHYGVTAVLAISLLPALKAAGLPTKIDWPRFLLGYWVGLGVASLFWACLLCVVGFPTKDTILPIWSRYKQEKGRFLILIPLLAYVYWLHGFQSSIVLCTVGVATFELADRTRNVRGGFSRSILSFLLPAAYLFLGLTVVFAFNQVVVALKFHEAYDKVFDRIDTSLLLGRTVSEVAHEAMVWLPTWVYHLFDFAYFTMLPLMGAGILITGLAYGRRRALQYVGTLLTAYYLSLLIFSFWPSQSPFYSCPTHFAMLPQGLTSYWIQKGLLTYLRLLAQHGPIDSIGTGYYIAFPCMHIVQPVILVWFLRRWKRLFVGLVIYSLFLMVSIVMLEFHYVIDLFGGIAVALLAILIVDGAGQAPERAEARFTRPG